MLERFDAKPRPAEARPYCRISALTGSILGQLTRFDFPDDLEAPNSRPNLLALHFIRT